MEYRYYRMPEGRKVFALLGEKMGFSIMGEILIISIFTIIWKSDTAMKEPVR